MPARRLLIFDVDGTLVDSEAEIAGAMARAYGALGLAAPGRARVRRIVGLSLPEAFARLSPELADAESDALVAAYRAAFADRRRRIGAATGSPLFAGARSALDALAATHGTVLGIATGKSRRGLDALIAAHGLHGRFATTQVADDHPSKPDPAMIRACLDETGVAPGDAVMIGDTSFDMDMARAAAVRSVAVAWGYHPAATLGADRVAASFAALPAVIDAMFGIAA